MAGHAVTIRSFVTPRAWGILAVLGVWGLCQNAHAGFIFSFEADEALSQSLPASSASVSVADEKPLEVFPSPFEILRRTTAADFPVETGLGVSSVTTAVSSASALPVQTVATEPLQTQWLTFVADTFSPRFMKSRIFRPPRLA